MNDQFDPISEQQTSAFLPIVLLGIAVLLFNLFQLSMLLPQRTQLQRIITQNEQAVAQSREVQGKLQKIVEDLVNISKDNKDAQAIIAKYNISVRPNGAAPAAK